jgi:hypothetical protein
VTLPANRDIIHNVLAASFAALAFILTISRVRVRRAILRVTEKQANKAQ